MEGQRNGAGLPVREVGGRAVRAVPPKPDSAAKQSTAGRTLQGGDLGGPLLGLLLQGADAL